MATIVICGRNYIADAGVTLSGGAWNASYPLDNLKTSVLAKVARTTNALAASSTLIMSRTSSFGLTAVGLFGHNISHGATYELTLASDAAFTTNVLVLTGSVVSAYGSAWRNLVIPIVNGANSYFSCQYLKLIINDPGNLNGYIQAGCLYVCPLQATLRPSYNLSFGYDIGYSNDTDSARSLAGVEYFATENLRRLYSIPLNYLTEAERSQLLYLQSGGASREWLIHIDPAATSYGQVLTLLGRVKRPNPIKSPYVAMHATELNVEEII